MSAPPCSLSPMGIQNIWRARTSQVTQSFSLSPMGIQNASTGSLSVCPSRLTIPHGDSKRRRCGWLALVSISSLSPMGIQNIQECTTCGLQGPQLTIPHGDSKPPVSTSEKPSLACASHYPPWGFKTPILALLAVVHSRLTIPHGDSKPPFLHLKNLPAPPEESTCPPNIYSYDLLFKNWSVSPGKPAPGTG